MDKILTIGITTFEETTYLFELLSNVSKQFRSNNLHEFCDVIVLNDGGNNEETFRILNQFDDEFTVVLSEVNTKSPSDSRNKIIDLANSKYILFMDGDDNFVDSLAALCKELMESSTKDIFISPLKKIVNGKSTINGSFIYSKELFSISDEEFEEIHHKLVVHQTGIWSIYNLSFLKNNNIYYDSKTRYEDNLFMTKIALTPNVRYGRVYTSYYGWRLNFESFSHIDNKSIIKYRVQLFIKTLEAISRDPQNKFSPYLLYSVWNQTYGNIARKYPSTFSISEFKMFLKQLNDVSNQNKSLIKQMLKSVDGHVKYPYFINITLKTFYEPFAFIYLKMIVNALKNKVNSVRKKAA